MKDIAATDKGSFTDGSGENSYLDNTDCSWLLTAASGTIQVTIDEFLIESDYDYLYLYDGSTVSSALLGKLTGSLGQLGTRVFTSTGPIMLIHFTSDEYISFSGTCECDV